MMFIELMFWKNASVAESVRDEYSWRVSFCCSHVMVRQTTFVSLDSLLMLSLYDCQHLLQGWCFVSARIKHTVHRQAAAHARCHFL